MRGERCPGCGAPRLPMAHCPQCGAVYPAPAPPATPPGARPGAVWRDPDDDPALELKLRAIAPPVVLALGFLIYGSEGGRSFFRVFVSMWLHELGHALTALALGFPAFPGPWRTSVSETRSPVLVLMILAGLGALAYRAYRADGRRLAAVLAAAALAHLGLVLAVPTARAQLAITFGGDGGGMVLGAALVASFFVERGHYLQRTWLRWGFLVIGAFAYLDPARQWFRARHDPDAVPFGEIEGVGLSDPTKLVEVHGWSERALISRYVTLAVVCAVAMAGAYALGVWRARRAALTSSPARSRPGAGR